MVINIMRNNRICSKDLILLRILKRDEIGIKL